MFGFTVIYFKRISSKVKNHRDDLDFHIAYFLFVLFDCNGPVLPLMGFTFFNVYNLLQCLVMY